MAYLPIALAGGTRKHTDLSLTAQRTINFFPQLQPGGNEKSPYTLESFYGLKSFSSGTGIDRGIFSHKGILYHLSGTTLYSVDSAGTKTAIDSGNNVPGDSKAVFDASGDDVVFAADGVAYLYDVSAGTITAGTDPDFETPNTVTTINNQCIYDGDDGRFAVADVGAPLTLNALNYATAETKPDNLIRPFAFNTTVYMFGGKTIEQWWNNGVGDPPFEKIENGTLNIGLGAQNTVANDDDGVYFLADDNQVYFLTGGVPVPLFPLTIVREIREFTTKSDAIGWTMQIDGQWFYVLKFTDANRTFIYPKGIRPDVRGEVFELSSGVSGGRYNGNSYAFAYGKHLVANEGGDINELDTDTYTENGNLIKRVRVTAPIHGGLFNRPGKDIEISFFKLIGATGKGLASGQGSDPEVILQYSQDGQNWSNEIRANVGRLGLEKELVFEIGESYETWVFRIISTDPIYSNWHSAGIEAEIGI